MTDVSAPPQPATTTGDRSSIQLYLSERGWGGDTWLERAMLAPENTSCPIRRRLMTPSAADSCDAF